jgi:hypothetical protein
MMIFVVGPSRGGKTTLVSAVLPQFPTLRLLDLDAEEERCVSFIRSKGGQPGGWEDRWRRNKECLRLADVSPPDTDLIVDVGAGSLETAEGRRFFIARGAVRDCGRGTVAFSLQPPRPKARPAGVQTNRVFGRAQKGLSGRKVPSRLKRRYR